MTLNEFARYTLMGVRIVGIAGILGTAITGKQNGGRKLHMVYRIMIFFIFAVAIASFFFLKYAK
jgi:hypothetical protein